MRVRPASPRAKLLLLLTSSFLCLVAVELGLRARTHLFNQRAFQAVFSSDSLPPEFRGGELQLAGMIRPVANPKIIYELRPGLSGLFNGGRLSINGDGFRSRGHAVEKPGGTVRVVGIGDSFMFGLGVGNDETYLSRLEDLLNRHPESSEWQVINTAVPGYNTVMEVETLRDRGLEYSPDHVLIEFVANDIDLPNFIRTGVSPLALRSFIADWFEERLRRKRWHPSMRLLHRGGLSAVPLDETGMRFKSDPQSVPQEYRSMVGWNAYVGAMEELRELQREGGFDVALLSLTISRRGHKPRALELARSLGFSVVDVGPALESYMEQRGIDRYLGSELSLSETNGHPSAIAHEIAARELYAYLMAKNRPRSESPAGARTESR